MPSKFGGIEVADTPSSAGSKFGGVAVGDESSPKPKLQGVAPRSGVAEWLKDAAGDIRHGTDSTIIGRGYRALGGTGVGDSPVSDFMASPVLGPLKTAQGVAELPSHPARGFADATDGIMQTGTLPGAFMGAASPVTALRAIIGGKAGGKIARGAAGLFGASPDVQDAVGNAGELAGGGLAVSPKTVPFLKGAASAIPQAARENLHIPRTIHGLFTEKLPVPAAVGYGVGHLVGHPYAGAVTGAVSGMVPPVVRGGIAAASGEPWTPRGLFPVAPVEPPARLRLGAGPIITEPPPDGSYVRSAPGMYQPPNPARALPPAPRIIEMPGVGAGVDSSYVRSAPGMYQPPNPARALPAGGNVYQMPPIQDSSYVRSVPAELPIIDAEHTPIPRTPVADTPASHSQRVKSSRAKFDANGIRNRN